MVLASRAKGKMPPRRIAEIISKNISSGDDVLAKVEIAGPGFMNFFIREDVWSTLLRDVDKLGDGYGCL